MLKERQTLATMLLQLLVHHVAPQNTEDCFHNETFSLGREIMCFMGTHAEFLSIKFRLLTKDPSDDYLAGVSS